MSKHGSGTLEKMHDLVSLVLQLCVPLSSSLVCYCSLATAPFHNLLRCKHAVHIRITSSMDSEMKWTVLASIRDTTSLIKELLRFAG